VADDICYTFHYSTIGANFADDAPGHEIYLVSVHLFVKDNAPSLSLREQTKRLLFMAGFTWPEETNVGIDGEINAKGGYQHYVFECELVQGVDVDG